jgi:hypothetical protein
MHAANDDTAPTGLRGWWTSPPRSGLRLIISPWEYRHLRPFAGVRIAGGVTLACLALITLAVGGGEVKTYAWTLVFLIPGMANLAFAFWELRIARSLAAGT